jgi:hypothetical protein
MCTMGALKEEKLKRVLKAVPAGFVVDSRWLETQGISRFLTRKYIESSWLERVERGVFRRPTPQPTPLDWHTCLLSLQHIMANNAHVGGVTALELQGYSHYLRLGGRETIWLYGDDIPSWLARLKLNASVVTRGLSLFRETDIGLADRKSDDLGERLPWDWALRMSTSERAILEALDELPDNESFHNLDMVFQGLATLSPRRLTALLHSCRKIKVIRLFFVYAERHNHAWWKHLNPDEFQLGTGDRALVRGGKIHPRFRIMVPPEFVQPEMGNADGP